MNKGVFQLLICLCFSVVTLANEHAKEFYAPKDVRSISMGHTGSAFSTGVQGLFENPSGLANESLLYSYQKALPLPDTRQSMISHAFVLQSFGYMNANMRMNNGDRWHHSVFGYGKSNSNGIDWGIRYKRMEVEKNNSITSGWSSDIGMKARLLPYLDVGITGHNIFKQNIYPPAKLSSGISLHTPKKSLLLSVDVTGDLGNRSLSGISSHLGLEAIATEGLHLQAGWHDSFYTIGVAAFFPYASIQYAYEASIKNSKEKMYAISVSTGRYPSQKTSIDRQPLMPREYYAQLNLNDDIYLGNNNLGILKRKRNGSYPLLDKLQTITNDPSCKGIIVHIKPMTPSLHHLSFLNTVRHYLKEAKRSGKETIIHIDSDATLQEYYVASVGQTIIMPKLGAIKSFNLGIEFQKFGRLLDQVGITTHVIRSGKNKAAMSPFTQKLNLDQRDEIYGLINDVYEELLQEIREERDCDWESLLPRLEQKYMFGTQAKKVGLVDETMYFYEVYEYLNKKKEGAPIYIRHLADMPETTQKNTLLGYKIAVIDIEGSIESGKSKQGVLFGNVSTGAEDIERIIKDIEKNKFIKGVIVRINSPGGGVLASDRIYRALKSLSKKKPVIAYLSNIAASGGYYIALGADKIYASPWTLTGSVGVISTYISAKKLADNIGIDHTSLSTGESQLSQSLFDDIWEEQRHVLQQYQDYFYKEFRSLVKNSRQLTNKEVNDIAQGHIIIGKNAKKLKMVDGIQTFHKTLQDLSKSLQLSQNEYIHFPVRGGYSFSNKGIQTLFQVINMPQFFSSEKESKTRYEVPGAYL